MLTPSTIAKKPSVRKLAKSEYSFPDQVREDDIKKRNPLIAANYTFGSIQTYNWSGQPYDANADWWDWKVFKN